MYTIKQAAMHSGLTVALLRAWERRYRIVTPSRTQSGYRLYDDGAIATLRRMRELIADGWAPSEAARAILAGEVSVAPSAREVVATGSANGPDERPSGLAPEAWRSRFVDAAARLDSADLQQLLDEAFARASFEVAASEFVMPGLVAVGQGWAEGRLSVAAEHTATNAVMRRLGAQFEAAGRAPDRPDVVVGLPPGSRHEAGALAFAVAARRIGLRVLYLGSDVPIEDWVASLPDRPGVAAVVGVVTPADAEATQTLLVALRKARPNAIRAVGGVAAAAIPGDPGLTHLPDQLDAAARRLLTALTGDA